MTKFVTVYHPDLDWSKETTVDTARVLERSGWQIVEDDSPAVSGNATVGAAAVIAATTPIAPPADEPTEPESPSVSSDEESSSEE